jgi:hypothetical protein
VQVSGYHDIEYCGARSIAIPRADRIRI